MKAHISEEFFSFFKKLAANNNKDWFDSNKKWYESAVKQPFENLVAELLSEMAKLDKSYANVQPKDCIFRINRDVRFSADKRPYKLNRSALISSGGKKDMHSKGFYLELGPEECGIYAGVYMAEKPHLNAIRSLIAANGKAFRDIISDKNFVSNFGEIQGEAQKRLDPEFKAAAEKEPLIFNKQFYVKHVFSEKEATSDKLVSHLIKVAKASEPLQNFLEKAQPKAAKAK
jgi:uncharacterized protein (TIGR02453 family)